VRGYTLTYCLTHARDSMTARSRRRYTRNSPIADKPRDALLCKCISVADLLETRPSHPCYHAEYRRTPNGERWNSALLGWEAWLAPRYTLLPHALPASEPVVKLTLRCRGKGEGEGVAELIGLGVPAEWEGLGFELPSAGFRPADIYFSENYRLYNGIAQVLASPLSAEVDTCLRYREFRLSLEWRSQFHGFGTVLPATLHIRRSNVEVAEFKQLLKTYWFRSAETAANY